MEITKGLDNAHYSIIIDKEKYEDRFIDYGKICSIDVVLKENNNPKFKIKIGEKELSDDDFIIKESYIFDLSQTIIKGNCSKHNSEIEFKKDDIFYLEQSNLNIHKIIVWINEFNGKSLKEEYDSNLEKCLEITNSIQHKKEMKNLTEKFEMKSRESRCIFDSNIYSIDKLGLRLGFRTEIILNENLVCSIKDYDFFGQSCEIFIDLKDYHISGEEFISYIKQIEENYKPELLNSSQQVKQFLSRAGFRKINPFNVEELKQNGWIKKSNTTSIFGDNSYIYEKKISDNDFCTRSIRVIMNGDEIDSIKTKSGCADRLILSMDDLEYYFNNNQ